MTPILDRIRAHGGEVIRDGWSIRLRRGRLTPEALAWLKEPHVRDRLMLEVWPEYDEWSERAAICEHDAGMSRDDAERFAYAEVTTANV